MSYNLKQQLDHINEENYDDVITATVGDNEFIAVTANAIEEGASERQVTVQIMELELASDNECKANTGVYTRQEGEKSVKATLLDKDGKEVDSNVVNY